MFSLWSAFPVMGETLSRLAAALCISLVFFSLWEAANREWLAVGVVLRLYPAPSSVPSNPSASFTGLCSFLTSTQDLWTTTASPASASPCRDTASLCPGSSLTCSPEKVPRRLQDSLHPFPSWDFLSLLDRFAVFPQPFSQTLCPVF